MGREQPQPEQIFERLKLGVLASGETVYDKPSSHLHSSVGPIISSVLAHIESEGQDRIGQEIEVTEDLPLLCVEVDPEKDPLFLVVRRGRDGYSVFVEDREPGVTHTVTVFLIKSSLCGRDITPVDDGYTLTTAFSGPRATREPWDPWFSSGKTKEDQERRATLQQEALEFWTHHALIPNDEEFPVIPETREDFDPELLKEPVIPRNF